MIHASHGENGFIKSGSLGLCVVKGRCGGIFRMKLEKYPHPCLLPREIPETLKKALLAKGEMP